jgi:hypothetical protein
VALYFNENDDGAKVVVVDVLVEVLVVVDVVVVVPTHAVSPSISPVPTGVHSPIPKLVTIQFGALSIVFAHIFSVVPVNTVTTRDISSHPK